MSVENKTNRDQFIEHSTGYFRQRLETAERTIGQLAVARGVVGYDGTHTVPTEEWLQTMPERGTPSVDDWGKIVDYAFAKVRLDTSRDTAALINDRDYVPTGMSLLSPESESEK
jgi:hypothetical protein